MRMVFIALIVVVGFLIGVWYVTNSLRDNVTDVTDRIGSVDDGSTRDSAGIPLGKRVTAISTTGKVMFGSVFLLVLYIAAVLYQTFRTGSPAEFLYTQYLSSGALVLFGVAAGVAGKNVAESNHGWLHVVYESDSGEPKPAERIPVDVQAVEADNEGNPVVTEYKRRRILGLFRRQKLVAEDPTLQATDRPPGKAIVHQIPDFAEQIGENEWVIRTQDRDDVSSPGQKADYVYRQPIELSYEQYVEEREAKKRLEIKHRGLQSRFGAVTTEMRKLRRMLKSGKHKEEEQILTKVERIVDMVMPEEDDGMDEKLPEGPRRRVEMNGNAETGQQARADGGER